MNIPLQSVAISSGGRPNVSNGGHEDTIVVDEHDDLTIWCRTGFAYPAPDNLEIYIDNEKQSKVEIQTHTAQNGLSRMTGSMMIKSVNRAKVHGSQITCRGQWRDQVSESRSQISVFFPTTSVSVQVDEVAWNELLQVSIYDTLDNFLSSRFLGTLSSRHRGKSNTPDHLVSCQSTPRSAWSRTRVSC